MRTKRTHVFYDTDSFDLFDRLVELTLCVFNSADRLF